MQQLTPYHHLQARDRDTIDFLHFDRKLWYKTNNDTYGSVAAKTAKNDRASENNVQRETGGTLHRKGELLEERDGGWMIMETASDKVEDAIQRQQQVHLKLKLGDNSYTYTRWFTLNNVKGLEIILGKHLVCDIRGTYSIDYKTNQMCVAQGDISRDARE